MKYFSLILTPARVKILRDAGITVHFKKGAASVRTPLPFGDSAFVGNRIIAEAESIDKIRQILAEKSKDAMGNPYILPFTNSIKNRKGKNYEINAPLTGTGL